MIVVPFLPAHLDGLVLQPEQADIQELLSDPDYIASLTAWGPSLTAIADGHVIGCGGAVKLSKQRTQVWALVSARAGRHLLPASRIVEQFLASLDVPRIETPVRCDFEAGNRWAKLLGFMNETPSGLKKWGDDGKDYNVYARVK